MYVRYPGHTSGIPPSQRRHAGSQSRLAAPQPAGLRRPHAGEVTEGEGVVRALISHVPELKNSLDELSSENLTLSGKKVTSLVDGLAHGSKSEVTMDSSTAIYLVYGP